MIALLGNLPQVPAGTAVALAAAGGLALIQVLTWRPWAVRGTPLPWILHFGYAALGAGLPVATAHVMSWIVRAARQAHVIGIAGFSVLIIGMVTCTALGHLGRPLRTDHAMVISYALVILAAVLGMVALLPTAMTTFALHASAAAWVLAIALYLWRFFPMMIRPRADRPITYPAPRASH